MNRHGGRINEVLEVSLWGYCSCVTVSFVRVFLGIEDGLGEIMKKMILSKLIREKEQLDREIKLIDCVGRRLRLERTTTVKLINQLELEAARHG